MWGYVMILCVELGHYEYVTSCVISFPNKESYMLIVFDSVIYVH